MKVGLRFAVTSLLLVAFAVGCTCMQKSWGTGALAGAGVGAIAGGIATTAASNNSGAFNVGNDNEDKAVAIFRERPGSCLRHRVSRVRDDAHDAEAGHHRFGDHRVRAAADDDVGDAELEVAVGVTDGIGRRGAAGGDQM